MSSQEIQTDTTQANSGHRSVLQNADLRVCGIYITYSTFFCDTFHGTNMSQFWVFGCPVFIKIFVKYLDAFYI